MTNNTNPNALTFSRISSNKDWPAYSGVTSLRPFVVGRKNWLFSDSVVGATASANRYSLIETATPNGIEPYHYLRHLFHALPIANSIDDYKALLFWNFTLPD